ncbi:hypothetical protein QE152_g36243, partial [Popillia japonica]
RIKPCDNGCSSLEQTLQYEQDADSTIQEITRSLAAQESPFYELINCLVYRKCGDHLLFVVPRVLENHILNKYHDKMGHFDMEKTTELIPELVPEDTRKGDTPFDTLHVDHFDPYEKTRHGKKYILVIVDGFTNFTKLYACKSVDTLETIKHVLSHFNGRDTRHQTLGVYIECLRVSTAAIPIGRHCCAVAQCPSVCRGDTVFRVSGSAAIPIGRHCCAVAQCPSVCRGDTVFRVSGSCQEFQTNEKLLARAMTSRVWSAEEIKCLILNYETLPELWQISNADYKNRVKKAAALERKSGQATSENYESTWEYFASLKFLIPSTVPVSETEGNLSVPSTSNDGLQSEVSKNVTSDIQSSQRITKTEERRRSFRPSVKRIRQMR